MNNFFVNFMMVVLFKVDFDEVEVLNRFLEGSEDQIIFDSDEEDDIVDVLFRKFNLF